MWDPPGPGLEPVSPALVGRFSTTAPPGKPLPVFLSETCVQHCLVPECAPNPCSPQGGLASPPPHCHTASGGNFQTRRLKTVLDTVLHCCPGQYPRNARVPRRGRQVWFLACWLKSGLTNSWSCLLLLKQNFFEISFFHRLSLVKSLKNY